MTDKGAMLRPFRPAGKRAMMSMTSDLNLILYVMKLMFRCLSCLDTPAHEI